MMQAQPIVRAVKFEPRLAELFAYCIGAPTDEKIRNVWGEYAIAKDRELWIAVSGSGPIGLVGIDTRERHRIIIRHIAVSPATRGRGIGTQLIGHVAESYPLAQLEAETDRDAVTFYQRRGFTVRSLGERYPGCERFCCVKVPLEIPRS